MNIRQRDFRAFSVRYHRNGSTGEGFHVCQFLFLQDRRSPLPMRAVVFGDRGRIAVLSDDISERWCGDDFEPALREAIAAVERAQPETIHSTEPAL